jgi:hypothetical protein
MLAQLPNVTSPVLVRQAPGMSKNICSQDLGKHQQENKIVARTDASIYIVGNFPKRADCYAGKHADREIGK